MGTDTSHLLSPSHPTTFLAKAPFQRGWYDGTSLEGESEYKGLGKASTHKRTCDELFFPSILPFKLSAVHTVDIMSKIDNS